MAELLETTRREEGVTLVELLVVIVILGVIGALTVGAIVTGFGAARTSDAVGETLDGTRIAVQRVRDTLRNADEVCTGSTDTSLSVWVDDDGDGAYSPEERILFERTGTQFQRVSFDGAGNPTETLLIRDDIIDATLFVYNGDLATAADQQPTDIRCIDGGAADGTGERITRVDLQFRVVNPSGGAPLDTATSIQVRNSELSGPAGNNTPIAALTVTCDASVCTFDATGSTDLDGDATIAAYNYDLGFNGIPGFDGIVETDQPTYQFDYSLLGLACVTEYDVNVVVVDDDGAASQAEATARPSCLLGGNAAPVADIELVGCGSAFSLTADTCRFSAAGTTDSDDATADLDFTWTATSRGPTPPTTTLSASGGVNDVIFDVRSTTAAIHDVSVTATDPAGASDASDNLAVRIGSDTIRVVGATNTSPVTNKGAISFNVTYTVRATSGNAPPGGTSVTATVLYQRQGNNSPAQVTESRTCSGATCTITFSGLKPNSNCMTVELESVSGATYDPIQNADGVERLRVNPSGGTC